MAGQNQETITTFGAVSYTHLDVYKRQMQYGTSEHVIIIGK